VKRISKAEDISKQVYSRQHGDKKQTTNDTAHRFKMFVQRRNSASTNGLASKGEGAFERVSKRYNRNKRTIKLAGCQDPFYLVLCSRVLVSVRALVFGILFLKWDVGQQR